MAAQGTFGIEKRGIAHLLSDSNFVVPMYQRSYAWEKRNVLDYLEDISRAVKKDAAEYFLGSIVVSVPSDARNKPEVIDGQQRLATTTILIAQIRDYFSAVGDSRHQDIDGQYLMNRDLRSKQDVQKLQLNARDNDFFLNSVLRPTTTIAPQRDSHRAIQQAKELCAAHVRNLVTVAKSSDILVELVLFLRERAQVIALSVPSDENAFVLFETLNDRGLDLALSDLLKNYLFRLGGDRVAEVLMSWVSMYALFEASNTEGEVVDFIRQTYSATHGVTREKELFTKIKAEISGKTEAIEFAELLRRQASLYQALLNPGHAHWKDYSVSAPQHIATLNFLGLTRIRPLLLAVLEKFNHRNAEVALRRAVSWGVRLTVLGNIGSGSVEESFCQRAKEVHNSKIVDADSLSAAIESVMPTDAIFEEAFKSLIVTKAKLARYLLQAIERKERNENEPELVVNTNPEELNLEHELPQSPDLASWPGIPTEVAAAYAYRLGNMVLLKKTENESLGNGGFATKKQLLAASSLILTKQVGVAAQWTPDEIKERQEKLAKVAVRVWPLR